MTRVFLPPGVRPVAARPGEARHVGAAEVITLTGDDARHLTKVLRMGPGDRYVAIADGIEFTLELTEVGQDAAVGKIVSQAQAVGEPPIKITLIQGLAKGEKMELVIQKGTEMGVSRFIPVETERSVVQLTERKASDRIERWQRIAREAAEQCRRGAVPEVSALSSWESALREAASSDLRLVPWEEETALGLRSALASLRASLSTAPASTAPPSTAPPSIAVYIGPEGGLTRTEVDSARAQGALAVSLGPRILRTETAGLAVVAAIMYELGDLGEPRGT
jgi:16S rRNA (uracil1498-N3)-methyltransferase